MMSMQKGKGQRSDDTMEDDSDGKDTKRKFRNLSEKRRRDQFNLLVNELSSMVSAGGKKMDKSTILKATICFLKNHNEITVQSQVHEIKEDWKPSFLTNEEFVHLVLEAIDGFIIIFSTSGQIYYASDNIYSLLGHTPTDLLKMTVFEMTAEEEQNSLYNALRNRTEGQAQISFSCCLRRGLSNNSKQNFYERVNFAGYVRSNGNINQPDNNVADCNSSIVFIGTGRLQTPQLIREMSLKVQIKSEFASRHSLEWKFLFLDHRAPPLIGYLPFEVLGTSVYDYYHVDDLDKVMACHETLMQKGEENSCFYRFLTKGQQWIWLRSRFYITYHQWNSKPEFIVCSHRVLSLSDVLKQSMKTQNDENCIDISSTSTQYMSDDSSRWTNRSCTYKTFETDLSGKSMTADSLDATSLSMTSQSSNTSNNQNKFLNVASQSSEYAESPQYVTSIQMQPVVTNFGSPIMISSIPPIEITQDQDIFQVDLQRKHAELQASIGQQQAELRAVSEQLLMSRLGLIPSQAAPLATSFAYSSTGTVSSTTTFAGSTITAVVPTVTLVPSIPQTEMLTPLLPIQPNMIDAQVESLYLLPDSNTPPNLEELK